jgi:hypothetical protein
MSEPRYGLNDFNDIAGEPGEPRYGLNDFNDSPRTGADLLDDVDAFLAGYIVFPTDDARAAVSLWILHCHAIEAFESTPRLALISPEKGSGKTRSLEVLALLVPEPMHAVNMSPAALFRVIAEKQPTLLLDEADTYLGNVIAKQHEELRGLINAGHRRGATVYRCEVAGKTVRGVEFPAFAACALAGIGDLPDTILDRSVIVAMKRRAPDEHVTPFRERIARPGAELLRASIARWAGDHVVALEQAWPEMPDGITDRAADIWEPLLAVADAAGGDWPERGRSAAVAICNARAQRDPSLGVLLLGDCQRLFTERDVDRLTTENLVEALTGLDDAPWGDLRGKPLDARGLARRLRKYEVRPGNHRFDENVLKGYRREDFHDAWNRYLPPVADVAHVAHPGGQRGAEADQAVALFEDEQGYVPSSISLNPTNNNKNSNGNGALPSTSTEGQQALHEQPNHDEDPDNRPGPDELYAGTDS